MKKIIYILIAILGVIIIAGGLYWYFVVQNPDSINTSQDTQERGFFPFGQQDDVDESASEEEQRRSPESRTLTEETVPLSPFRQITNRPIAGSGFIFDGGQTFIRYVDRASGNVFDVPLESTERVRRTQTTIPAVHEAFILNNDMVLLRYLNKENVIETFLAQITPSATSTEAQDVGTLSGDFLAPNIIGVEKGPDGSQFFTLAFSGGGASGVITSTNGPSQEIFTSPVSEWLASWNSPNELLLTTKPASSVLGYAFTLNTNGALTKVLDATPGLTTNQGPNGSHILYSTSFGDTLELHLLNRDTNETTQLGLTTLPEKCVWSSDATTLYCAVPQSIDGQQPLPERWYQGVVSFSDDFWAIDVETGRTEFLFNPQELDISVDATHLDLNDSENHLSFINKKDLTLWVFTVEQGLFGATPEESQE